MALIIETKTLQKLVNKVARGASNNKLLALTSFVNICLKDGRLSLTTTDMTNYVTATEHNVTGDNFEVVISLNNFAKLVSKTTTESITLDLTEKSLKFIGNGTYNIELPLNEENKPIKFPTYKFVNNGEAKTFEVKKSDITNIINTNKSCLSADMTQPVLTYYYCGNNVISADQYNICINPINLFNDSFLISNVMMDLISLFGEDTIQVDIQTDSVMFSSPTYCVFGKLYNDVENYPAEAIEAYIDTKFIYNCHLYKDKLIGAVDRLSIFVDKLDEGRLVLKFTDKNLTVYNATQTAFETIDYVVDEDIVEPGEFNCTINGELLKAQLNSLTSDVVNLWYGEEPGGCIKIEDHGVVKITSLMEE